jgi:hypothetical protein
MKKEYKIKSIVILVMRLLLYPVSFTLFYLIKDMALTGGIGIKSYNLSSIIYICSILYVIDIISNLIFLNKEYYKIYILFLFLLIIFIIFIQIIGIKINIITLIILIIISSIAWIIPAAALKAIK